MPQPFKIHVGVAAPLLINNIDTDQIIPSREMKTVSKEGLGKGLFAGWRYVSAEDKRPNEDFVLNMPEYAGASILLGGANFGCGSSREHAVWALAEYGVRAVIAPSIARGTAFWRWFWMWPRLSKSPPMCRRIRSETRLKLILRRKRSALQTDRHSHSTSIRITKDCC